MTDDMEKAYSKELLKVKGARVTAIIVSDEGDDVPYCGFLMETLGGKCFQVIALRDPEGNGPGHMDVTDVTKTSVG